MKITIITVAFNASQTIANTLRSVAGQTYPNLEHIVVDGGSKDGTQEIVAQHSWRIAHFISKPDHGIYDAMNKGVALASGDVIGFLNADDVYADPEVVQRIAMAMQADQLDAVFGDVAFFHSDAPDKTLRYYRSARFRPERISWGWMPAHPTLYMSKQIFDRVGPFRTDYRIAGDYEFVARAFHNQNLRYRYLPEVLVRMRLGGVSTGGWRNTLVLNREVMRACRENGIKTSWLKILSKYPHKFLELSM